VFLWYRTCKRKKRRRFERILAFRSVCDENSKYASEYPENVTVNELPKFNAVVKKRIKCLRKLVFMF
jgi:hypothetical protein